MPSLRPVPWGRWGYLLLWGLILAFLLVDVSLLPPSRREEAFRITREVAQRVTQGTARVRFQGHAMGPWGTVAFSGEGYLISGRVRRLTLSEPRLRPFVRSFLEGFRHLPSRYAPSMETWVVETTSTGGAVYWDVFPPRFGKTGQRPMNGIERMTLRVDAQGWPVQVDFTVQEVTVSMGLDWMR